jgi:hypothetical protein
MFCNCGIILPLDISIHMQHFKSIGPVEYGAGFIEFKEDGYFFVRMKDGSISTVETVKESQKIMIEMLPEGPIFILVNSGLGSTSDDDIYDYINKSDFKKRVKAQAIIVHDLATRLMGNIFLRFMKGERSVKIFSTQKDAEKWLFERMTNQEDSNGHTSKRLMLI